jgi:hypothetical protein
LLRVNSSDHTGIAANPRCKFCKTLPIRSICTLSPHRTEQRAIDAREKPA